MSFLRKTGPPSLAITAIFILAFPRFCLEAQGLQEAGRGESTAWRWHRGGRASFPFDSRDATKGLQGLSTRVLAPAMQLRSVVSHSDTVWIGTEGGLFAWVSDIDSVFPVGGPPFTGVNAVAFDDDGALWVGGDEGISVRAQRGWAHYPGEKYSYFERVRGLCNGTGRMWIATYGNGCGFMESGELRLFTKADSLLDDRVISVLEQDDRTVWIGTASGICKADGYGWHSLRYGNRIPVGAVEDMVIDERGNLFLAIARQGVARYNLGRVTVFGPAEGLPGYEINALSIDSTGRVWAAGRGGASYFDGSGWIPVTVPGTELGRYNFLSICHDFDGNTFLGTDAGRMFVVSGYSCLEVALPQGFPARMVRGAAEYGGELWFLTGNGIFRSRDRLVRIPSPDPWFDGAMTGLAIDANGGIWVSTRFGVLRFNGVSWEVLDRRAGLPTEHFAWVSGGTGGDMWLGTFDAGVIRHSGGAWAGYTVEDGLPSDELAGMVTDGAGTQWALSRSGRLSRFDGAVWKAADPPGSGAPAGSAEPFDSITGLDPGIRFLTPAGSGESRERQAGVCIGTDASGNCVVCLPDGIYINSAAGWKMIELPAPDLLIEPTCVLGTRHGELWLGTAGDGIFIRRGVSWRHLGACSGLSSDNITALFEDAKGRVWAGSVDAGVTICKWNK